MRRAPSSAGVSRRARSWSAATALIAVFVVTLAAGQYALDAGLGSRRVNPVKKPVLDLGKPIYTVNRATGEMQHNLANAFNDPVYRVHQRYTHDRFEYFAPGVHTAPARSTRAYGDALSRPSYSGSSAPRSPASRGGGSAVRAQSLAAPSYRVGATSRRR